MLPGRNAKGQHMAEISLKKRIWGWFFFDWASQPYNTLMLTFIFGPYFGQTAAEALMAGGMAEGAARAEAQALWGYGLTAAGLIIAVLAPILGGVADSSGRRMPWIWLFSALYVSGAWAPGIPRPRRSRSPGRSCSSAWA